MFENFGIKDVFYGLWKYKWRMVVFSIVLTGIVSIVVYKFPVKVDQPEMEIGERSELQCARMDFYLDYTGTDSELSSKALSNIYSSTIKEPACQHFTVDKIIGKYKKEKIVEIFDNTIPIEAITTSWFSQFVSVGTTSDGVGMYLLVRTPDMQFSKDILSIYMEWIQNLADEQNSKVDVVRVAESDSVLVVNTEDKQTLAEQKQWPISKVAIVSFVCFILLSCIGVFVICLFNPTLNRKNDFEELGLNVIAEVWTKRGE